MEVTLTGRYERPYHPAVKLFRCPSVPTLPPHHPVRGLRRAVGLLGLFGLGLTLLASTPHPGSATSPPILLADGTVARGDMVFSAEGAAHVLPFDRTVGTAAADGGWLAVGWLDTVDGPRMTVARMIGAGMTPGDDPVLLPLLPTPAGDTRIPEALPVTDSSGDLLGVAWIDGGTATPAVRYAAWEGDAWGAMETVSSAGDGSQLALSAAVTDGTVVLAWSAFDGEDDEILWAQRNATWSVPLAITDNTVPDITPALTARAEGGPWIAWSHYRDGQYRAVVSRLRDDTWSPPREVAGASTLYPSWQGAEGCDEPLLLLRNARPRGWQVVELDTTLRPLRRALTETPATGPALRPWIELETGELQTDSGPEAAVRFRWQPGDPGRSAPWEVVP